MNHSCEQPVFDVCRSEIEPDSAGPAGAALQVTQPPAWRAGDAWQTRGACCPVCLGALARSAGGGASRPVHLLAEDEERCPLTTMSYQPDGPPLRHMRDVGLHARRRDAFLCNWTRHFHVMRQLAPSLSPRRLAKLIDWADVLNLWSHPLLAEQDLPYVLLVLAGFIRQCGRDGEMLWVRVYFEGSLTGVNDKQLRSGLPRRVFRMVYGQPERFPFPTSRELLSFTTEERQVRFLEGPLPPPVAWREQREFHRCLLECGD